MLSTGRRLSVHAAYQKLPSVVVTTTVIIAKIDFLIVMIISKNRVKMKYVYVYSSPPGHTTTFHLFVVSPALPFPIGILTPLVTLCLIPAFFSWVSTLLAIE